MKSRLTTFIMIFIILLILGVFAIFGMIFLEEFEQLESTSDPEYFQTTVSDNEETIDNDIETPKIIENNLNDIKDGNSETIDYSQVKINYYFYNQLEDNAKKIYRALEANKDNLKTGTYQIKLGNIFSNLLSKENGQEELGRYYQSAIEAYTYDHADVFYISPSKMYLNIETTTKLNKSTYNVYINNGEENNYLADGFSSEDQVDIAINQINNIKDNIVYNKTSNTYQNIKMVHDYLVDNTQYDTTISKDNIYNVYGTLVNKTAVCEGYARTFKYLMDELNIPCVLIIGKGTNSEGKMENHAWNYVQIEKKWYAVDATWDDPIVTGGMQSLESKYKYFLKGSTTFNKDHSPNGQFTPNGKVFEYPNLSKNDL